LIGAHKTVVIQRAKLGEKYVDTLVNLILRQLKSGEITRDVAHTLLQEIKHQRASGTHTPATATPQPTGSEIAVIGMHCRFPDADTVEAFWQNLTQGRDSITEFPQERCPHAEFYSPDLGQPNKSYTKYGGFVEGIDQFATTFFKMSPQEAALIDPQQRLFFETALHTFQSAGYGSKRLWGSKTAVFVGARMSTYESHDAFTGGNFRFSLTGNLTNFIAARVSDFFNLTGPALTVDTACSSALVAIHYACQSLANGECTMALVGGVNLHITPYSFVNLSNNSQSRGTKRGAAAGLSGSRG
jgi:acyl transferase domain-containing protein